jgi:hypothetical protein
MRWCKTRVGVAGRPTGLRVQSTRWLSGIPRADGLDAFERIGVETREVLERRPASVVVVELIYPKFVRKGQPAAPRAAQEEEAPKAPMPSAPEEPCTCEPRVLMAPALLYLVAAFCWSMSAG